MLQQLLKNIDRQGFALRSPVEEYTPSSCRYC
nr:MAG TPA: hypothetical protein [Crassvirales sp.]